MLQYTPMAQLKKFDDTPVSQLKTLHEQDDSSFEKKPIVNLEETKEDHFTFSNVDLFEARPIVEIDSESPFSMKELMKRQLNERFNAIGVQITDVIIHCVRFSDEVRDKMAQKTVILAMEREKQAQNYYDIVSIVQSEELKTFKQTFDEEKMSLLKNGEYDQIVHSMELNYDAAKAQKVVEEMRVQTEADVDLIKAESDFTVQKHFDDARLEAIKIAEESKAEADVALVEAMGDVTEVEAITDMQCANFESLAQKGKSNSWLSNTQFTHF